MSNHFWASLFSIANHHSHCLSTFSCVYLIDFWIANYAHAPTLHVCVSMISIVCYYYIMAVIKCFSLCFNSFNEISFICKCFLASFMCTRILNKLKLAEFISISRSLVSAIFNIANEQLSCITYLYFDYNDVLHSDWLINRAILIGFESNLHLNTWCWMRLQDRTRHKYYRIHFKQCECEYWMRNGVGLLMKI